MAEQFSVRNFLRSSRTPEQEEKRKELLSERKEKISDPIGALEESSRVLRDMSENAPDEAGIASTAANVTHSVRQFMGEALRQDSHPQRDRNLTLDEKFNNYRLQNEDFPQRGLDDPLMRMRVKGFADNFEEAQSTFQAKYPEGALLEQGGRLYFTKDASVTNPEFDVVDPSLFEGHVGFNELINDLADLTGLSLETIGAIASDRLHMSRLKKAYDKIPKSVRDKVGGKVGTLTGRTAADAGGAAAGKAVEEGLEEFAIEGLQGDSGAIAETALWGVAGSLGASAASTVWQRVAKGTAINPQDPDTIKAMQYIKESGSPAAMFFQLSDSAILKRSIAQDVQGSKVIPNEIKRRLTSSLNIFDEASESALPKGRVSSRDAFKNTLHDYERVIFKELDKAPQNSSLVAGGYLVNEIAAYKELSSAYVDRLYKDVIAEIGTDPVFDLTPARNAAREIMEPSVVRDVEGRVLTNQQISEAGLRYNADLDGELKEVAEIIERTIASDAQPSYDALKNLRSRLYDLKTPDAGSPMRERHRNAGNLYSAITEVIENPVNDNIEFITKWQTANKAAADRFNTMEDVLFRKIAQSGERAIETTPSMIVDGLTKRGQAENLQFLKKLDEKNKKLGRGGKSALQATQEYFVEDSMNKLTDGVMSPEQFKNYLSEIGEDVFRTLMPDKSMRTNLLNLVDDLQELEVSGVRNIIERETADSVVIDKMLLQGDNTARIDMLKKMMKTSPQFTKRIERGILDNITKDLKVAEGGLGDGLSVNYQILDANIQRMQETGAIQLLPKEQVERLDKFRAYLKVMSSVGSETGASLEVASTTTAVARLESKAIAMMLKYNLTSRLFTSQWFNDFMIGDPTKIVERGVMDPFYKDRISHRFFIIGKLATGLAEESELLSTGLSDPIDYDAVHPSLDLRSNDNMQDVLNTLFSSN